MAEIKSFKGLMFNPQVAGNMNELVCPPYDIISEKQREDFIKRNEHNIIRLELPVGENAYDEAGKTLDTWLDEGVLKKDEKDGIYVYEMEFKVNKSKVKKVKGFISLVKLEEFSKGIILPHEETLSKAKKDRFNLMSKTFCNFSQIYSLYMDEDNSTFSIIDNASKSNPDIEVCDGDGVIHRLWKVYDKAIINAVCDKFKDKKLYIADGHHRYETALNFHKHLCEEGISTPDSDSGYVCMMLVNMENDGLVVFPTHRIVRGLENFDINTVIEKSSEYFSVTREHNIDEAEEMLEQLYNANKKAYALYTGESYYYLFMLKDENIMKSILPEMSDAYLNLDVSILHSLILERIFGIDKENMANQKNLIYTRDANEAIETVRNGNANCAFILNPTRVSEIRDVALANEKMPQKSTYFYPKLITGLVMNKFN